MKDYSIDTMEIFIFENIFSRFGCPKALMSDQGSHLLNSTIHKLTEEFMIHDQQSKPYHPHENGTVETFNKILEQVLTKICNVNKYNWNERVIALLWAHKMNSNKLS